MLCLLLKMSKGKVPGQPPLPLTQTLFPCYRSFVVHLVDFLCVMLCLPGSFVTVLGFLQVRV